jgi:hypothetical protein
MAHAHSMLVILGYKYTLRLCNIGLLLQQWLHERTSLLRYTYIACLVRFSPVYYVEFSRLLQTVSPRGRWRRSWYKLLGAAGPGLEYVTYVFVFLSSIIIGRLY